MVAIFLSAAVGLSVLLLNVFKSARTSPLWVFVASWTPILVTCLIPGFAEPDLQPKALTMIALAYGAVAAGELVSRILPFNLSTNRDLIPNPPRQATIDPTNLIRWHYILMVILAAYAVLDVARSLPLVQSVGGWNAVFTSAGGDFRRAQLETSIEAAQSTLGGDGAVFGILNYGLFLGHAAVFTGSVLWCAGRRLIGILPVLICTIYGLLSLQRTTFAMVLLLFLFAIFLLPSNASVYAGSLKKHHHPRTARITLGRAVAYLIGVAIASAAILYPLELRNQGTRNATGIESVTQYLASGILGLNSRIRMGSDGATTTAGVGTTEPGYGSYTFTNLFSVINRLGISLPNAPSFYDYYRVRLDGRTFVTNTGTAILDFYLDFGWLGIAGGFLLISLCAGISISRMRRGRVSGLPIAAFLLASLTWSFFGNSLLNDVRYLLATLLACEAIRRSCGSGDAHHPTSRDVANTPSVLPSSSSS
jgi:oligosaccharide repeat unit polymerase